MKTTGVFPLAFARSTCSASCGVIDAMCAPCSRLVPAHALRRTQARQAGRGRAGGRSRERRGFAYLIGLRPRDDGARSIDDGAVVEYEGGDLVIAGEALDLAASREQAVGAVTAVGPDDVRVVPGGGESSVGLGAGVAVGGS